MADNFTAEAVASAGQIFATDQEAGSSVHYPIGKMAWGALNTFNITSTAAPFPVQLFGNSSAAPITITTDSGSPPTVAVSGYVAPSTTVTVTGYTAPSTTVTITANSSAAPWFFTTDSGTPPTVAVSGYVAPSSTVTATITGITTSGGGGALDSTNSAIRVNVVADAIAGGIDIFSRTVITSPSNDIDVQFYKAAPSALLNVTTANSATATQNAGGALFSTSTNANGSVQGVTTEKTSYHSGSEIYCLFTAAFTAGIANSYIRIGLYDANEGFFIGYEGTSFGVTYRNNTSDTTVAKASWSEDTLTGAAGSLFTRAGTPEAIDLTKLNIFRIRFGWLGSAPVLWEVMAPDGHWVTFHKTLFPNLQATPSIRTPDLPMTLDMTKTAAAATDLTIQTDCWGAGSMEGFRSQAEDEMAFSTTTALAGSATYQTGVLALSPEFSQVQTHVLASHDGTVNVYWYSDPAGTDQVRLLTVPYVASDSFQLFAAPAFTPYVKYTFTNGSTAAQTDFYYNTKFLRRPVNGQLLRADGPIVGGMIAGLNRSLISAFNGSSYINIQATNGGNLKMSIQDAENDSGTAVFVDNSSTHPLYVSDSATPVYVRGLTDSTVPVTGTVTANISATADQNGATPWTGTISSAATLIKGSAGRLFSYHIGNTSTSANAFVKIYNDTAVALGTDSAVMDLFIPFGGGAVVDFTNGVNFGTGISVAAAATAGSTVHDTPPTVVATLTYV